MDRPLIGGRPVPRRTAREDRVAAVASALWRDRAVRQAVGIVLGLRLALGLVGWASIKLYPLGGPSGDWTALLIDQHDRSWPWLGPWQRWDGLWYQHLATSGYHHGSAEAQFFPLYPAVTHAVGVVLGGAYLVAALLVSTAALAAGLVLLHRLVARDLDSATADRTILYMAIAPTAFFFVAPFTESLFLMLSVATVMAARQRRFVLGGVLGTLSGLCRLVGVTLVVPLLVEAAIDARRRRRGGRRALHPAHAAALLPLLVVPGYDLWVRIVDGVPGGLREVEKPWGNTMTAPWSALHDSLSTVVAGHHPEELLNLAAAVALVVALPFMWRRLPLSYAAYATAMAVALLSRETFITPLGATARYILPVFPLIVLLAYGGRREWLDRLVLVSFPVLMTLLFFHFVHFGFVG